MERGRGGKELGTWLGRMCIKGPNPLHRQLFLRGGTRRSSGTATTSTLTRTVSFSI